MLPQSAVVLLRMLRAMHWRAELDMVEVNCAGLESSWIASEGVAAQRVVICRPALMSLTCCSWKTLWFVMVCALARCVIERIKEPHYQPVYQLGSSAQTCKSSATNQTLSLHQLQDPLPPSLHPLQVMRLCDFGPLIKSCRQAGEKLPLMMARLACVILTTWQSGGVDVQRGGRIGGPGARGVPGPVLRGNPVEVSAPWQQSEEEEERVSVAAGH